MDEFREPTLAAGALSPIPGEYAVVFDSAARSRRGLVPFPLLGQRRDTADAALCERASVTRRQPLSGSQPPTPAPASIAQSIVASSTVRPQSGVTYPRRRRLGAHVPVRLGHAPAQRPRLRLPGVEEHGERRAHPPEHAHVDLHLPRALTSGTLGVAVTRPRSGRLQGSSRSRVRVSGFAICRSLRSRSSIVGSASRSRWTERMNSSLSSSGVTTRSCFLRFCRSRSLRAALPKRRSRRGLSTATASAAARTSNTSHGQLTVGF